MDYRNLNIDAHTESEAKLINSLARGQTVAASAEISGISERTIYRLMKQPDFRRRLAVKRGEMLAAALGNLTDAVGEATAKLRELAKSKTEWIAVSATRAIMKLTVKLRSEVDVEERLQTLEDRESKQSEDHAQFPSPEVDEDDSDDSERELVDSLARGRTVADCAASTGTSERTITFRLSQSDFRRRIAAKRGEMLAAALGNLTDATGEVALILRRLMNSKTEWVALYAARAIVELSVELRSEVDFEDRLRALEDRAAKKRGEVDYGQ